MNTADGQGGSNSRAEGWLRMCKDKTCADVFVIGGAKLRLYPDSVIAEWIYKEEYEISEQFFTRRYLTRGDIFFDVGANLGLFTVIAARQVGPKGKVYAFEPAAIARKRLLENILLNEFTNVIVEGAALSDQISQTEILVPTDGCDAWSSLARPTWGKKISRQQISSVTLDHFCSTIAKICPTMIKIDVEGWESKVLQGGGRILASRNAPLLQVEFTDEAANAAGTSCQQLYGLIKELSYEICRYESTDNILVPDALRPSYPYINLYATKNLDADNARLKRSASRSTNGRWRHLVNKFRARN